MWKVKENGDSIGLDAVWQSKDVVRLIGGAEKARQIPQGAAADKWQLHRWLCEAKTILGINDRSLAVLSALLSFYPEVTLTGEGNLVVFPSNKQLALRAHGMADATLRRHLAALVEAGLIARQDSPNGKRYARRAKGGELQIAFGFSWLPCLPVRRSLKRPPKRSKPQRHSFGKCVNN